MFSGFNTLIQNNYLSVNNYIIPVDHNLNGIPIPDLTADKSKKDPNTSILIMSLNSEPYESESRESSDKVNISQCS